MALEPLAFPLPFAGLVVAEPALVACKAGAVCEQAVALGEGDAFRQIIEAEGIAEGCAEIFALRAVPAQAILFEAVAEGGEGVGRGVCGSAFRQTAVVFAEHFGFEGHVVQFGEAAGEACGELVEAGVFALVIGLEEAAVEVRFPAFVLPLQGGHLAKATIAVCPLEGFGAVLEQQAVALDGELSQPQHFVAFG